MVKSEIRLRAGFTGFLVVTMGELLQMSVLIIILATSFSAVIWLATNLHVLWRFYRQIVASTKLPVLVYNHRGNWSI
jgi:hypothetical protein